MAGFILLMSALQDENQIPNYLDFEEKKRAIDERIVHNEKLRDKQIQNSEDVEEDHATACQELFQERSDLKMKIEALLKSGKTGAVLRSLEDAEQSLADVRASVAVDKSNKNGWSHNPTKSKIKTMVLTRMTAKNHKEGLDHCKQNN